MEKVRVGVIGAGGMANRVHYPSLARIEAAELVAICDMNEERLHATADKYKVTQRYRNAREMWENERLDAVYIIMPPQHMFELVIAALERRLHVFTEKPPAVTTFQSEAMATSAREYGCLTMTAFNRRHIPVLRMLKERVHAVGPPTQVSATFYKPGRSQYFGGVIDSLHCDAIHAVDALRWLAGSEPTSVASLVSEYDDYGPRAWQALVRFENGATGTLHANFNLVRRTHAFEIHAPSMSAFVNVDGRSTLHEAGGVTEHDVAEVAGSSEFYVNQGFLAESQHFIECVLAGKQPTSNFADAARSMRLVDSILQNAAS